VSWRAISREELERMIPVSPPTVKRKRKPMTQSIGDEVGLAEPYKEANQEKILIPVGTAITIVADVKYARESTSIPTVNI